MRAHVRTTTLQVALSEFLRYAEDGLCEVKIHLLVDRPSWGVSKIITKYADRLWGLSECPFQLISKKHGERFMEALNFQVAALTATATDWLTIADDDRWWSPPQIDEELPQAMANEAVDIYYGRSLFFHSNTDTYTKTRHHDSVVLFRTLRGDRFPVDRTIQATEKRHDGAIMQGRVGHLATPLLDYGTWTPEERDRVYKAFTEAGKTDSYVESIRTAPELITYAPPGWRDLMKEATVADPPKSA